MCRSSQPRRSAWRIGLDALRLYLGLAQLALISLAWSLLAVPLYWVLPAPTGRRVGRRAIHRGFRMYLRWLQLTGACRFELTALDALIGQPPMIIAPNHPSLLDALLVLSRLPDLACIAKGEILDNLFLGAGARLARYIRNDAAHQMIKLAVAELRAGDSLLLFPEGTRTASWPVGKLNGAVGLTAKLAGVPVQTVLIETCSGFLGKGWPLFRRPEMPVVIRIRLGRRFAPPADVRRFSEELETYFRTSLPRGGLPPVMASACNG